MTSLCRQWRHFICHYGFQPQLWSNWNTSNWNTYLKYIICNLYFVFYLLSKCILYFNYIFQRNLYLKYNLGQTAPYASISSTTGCTIQNLWVKGLRYLSVHILQSRRTFKCSLSNHRKAVYRSANAIFGKIGLIVSEDIILQLINSTCISSLLYMMLMHVLWLNQYTYRLPDWLID